MASGWAEGQWHFRTSVICQNPPTAWANVGSGENSSSNNNAVSTTTGLLCGIIEICKIIAMVAIWSRNGCRIVYCTCFNTFYSAHQPGSPCLLLIGSYALDRYRCGQSIGGGHPHRSVSGMSERLDKAQCYSSAYDR